MRRREREGSAEHLRVVVKALPPHPFISLFVSRSLSADRTRFHPTPQSQIQCQGTERVPLVPVVLVPVAFSGV